MQSVLTSGWEGFLSLIYPPLCVGCQQRVNDPHRPLCPDCIERLEPAASSQIMSVLRRLPVIDTGIDGACAVWLFDQDSPLQSLLHTLKYENRPRLGVVLGRLLGARCQRWIDRKETPTLFDALVPIPLFRIRRLERGYNQSAQLAFGIQDVLELPVVENVLRRSRRTRSQTNLDRQERWENVSDAFSVVDAAAVAGRRLLLVDDVLTTGSTAAAAARALREAQAASVQVAALALARPHSASNSNHYK